jgi:N6-L-threonylcarbamoyladenine synthase
VVHYTGLSLSLAVGLKYGKQLCLEGKKPIIPIHHMKAHSLTCRMLADIQFPYLVLLISGGHCLLAVAKSIDHFELLGTTIDDAPGEAFDKVIKTPL